MNNQHVMILISEEEIKSAIIKAASEYSKMYENEQLTIIADLTNTFVFAADLIRELQIDTTIRFITKDYYENNHQKPNAEGEESLKDKNILIITGLLQSGLTSKKIYDNVNDEKPKNIKVLALIEKNSKNKIENFEVSSLFKVEDIFIVGYGITYNKSYGGLKGIYSLQSEVE